MEIPTTEIPAGHMFYHGTSAADDFEELESPAWVSQSRRVAQRFVGWNGGKGEPRILVFESSVDLELVLVLDVNVFFALASQSGLSHMDDDVHLTVEDMVNLTCDAGYDGWTIPFNYPDGDDTLLCDAASVLELVRIEQP